MAPNNALPVSVLPSYDDKKKPEIYSKKVEVCHDMTLSFDGTPIKKDSAPVSIAVNVCLDKSLSFDGTPLKKS